jgi:hypothetical protein
MPRCIDANTLQAQLERKKAGIANQRYIEGWNDFMMRVKSMVSKAPTIDVAPVVYGRWIHLGGDEWCCSACGFVITTEGSWDKPTKKYCEDCGAKMEGELI